MALLNKDENIASTAIFGGQLASIPLPSISPIFSAEYNAIIMFSIYI